mmetsp:Transcript_43438/g.104861  ORF Transcript_43438/g.104861 Transcript_43438/m.104861 type:complete len:134 (-) Transcript_43438:259-660(-)
MWVSRIQRLLVLVIAALPCNFISIGVTCLEEYALHGSFHSVPAETTRQCSAEMLAAETELGRQHTMTRQELSRHISDVQFQHLGSTMSSSTEEIELPSRLSGFSWSETEARDLKSECADAYLAPGAWFGSSEV